MTATPSPPESSDVQRPGGDPGSPAPNANDHCVFECGAQVFATSLGAVREVLSGKLATPVPQAPSALVGVIELHGDVLPIVQLSALIGVEARSYTPADAVVVLSSREARVGIAVDRVLQVRVIDPAALTLSNRDIFKGWYTRTTPRIAVLDADALVSHALQTVITHFRNALPDPRQRRSRRDASDPVSN